MDESLRLLLVEADMYKEEMEKTWFKFVQFSQRLQLTGREKLDELGKELLMKTTEFNEIAALLEQAAAAVSLALTETGEMQEQAYSEEIIAAVNEEAVFAPAEESVFAPVEESVFAPAEESVFAPAEESVFAPAEESVFAPAEESVFAPAEESVFAPAEESVFAPAEESVFAPAEESVFAPAVESVFAPAEEAVFPPADEMIKEVAADELTMLPRDEVILHEPEPQKVPFAIPCEFSFIDEDGSIYCGSCGNKLRKISKFCPSCGSVVKFREDAEPEKEETFLPEVINEPAPAGISFDFSAIEEEAPEEGVFESFENASETAPLSGYVKKARPAAYLLRHRDNSLIPVTKEEFFIGRDTAKTDFSIPDNNAISRVHMKIFYENERYYVCDCGSVNGTYLNEKAVSSDAPEILFDGCEIRINTETFSFQVSY